MGAQEKSGSTAPVAAPAAKRDPVRERIAQIEAEIRKLGGVTMDQSNELAALRTKLKLQGD